MSSDSSDDEDLAKLREAADSQFINDSMFDKKQESKTTKDVQAEKQPSLRPSRDEDDQFNLFYVSPEFRNYVAKQLSNILDKVLQKKLTNKSANCDSYIKPKRRKSGIKLFHNSPHYVKAKPDTVTPTVKKMSNTNSDDEDKDEDKFKSVAVNPEDILSKKETQYWSTRSKAPVYSYLQTKQGLILK